MFISNNLKLFILEKLGKSDRRIEKLEKKLADLERETQSQQEKLERYGINFR